MNGQLLALYLGSILCSGQELRQDDTSNKTRMEIMMDTLCHALLNHSLEVKLQKCVNPMPKFVKEITYEKLRKRNDMCTPNGKSIMPKVWDDFEASREKILAKWKSLNEEQHKINYKSLQEFKACVKKLPYTP